MTADWGAKPLEVYDYENDEDDPQAAEVYTWRLEGFKSQGWTKEWAEVLAGSRVDLRRVEKMLAQGCSHELVLSSLL